MYARIANRLATLVEGIQAVRVESDVRRELLSLLVTDRSGTEHEARALSDGAQSLSPVQFENLMRALRGVLQAVGKVL